MKTPTPKQTQFQSMKYLRRLSKQALLLATALAVMSGTLAQASSIDKNSSTGALTLGTSWSGGIAPGPNDIAVWDTGAFTTNSLGASTNWLGIQILGPSWPVTIANDGNTLTNGTVTAVGNVGIDMSRASQSLTLSNSMVINGVQNWNVASGQTLTLGGNLLYNPGSALRINLADNTANVYLTNGAPNFLLGASTNSSLGNGYFATLNDVDLAGLVSGGPSLKVVGGSTIGGLYAVNTATGGTPSDNGNQTVAYFGGPGSGSSVGWRVSGSYTYGALYFNVPQTYANSVTYNGVTYPYAWEFTHSSGRNITVGTWLITTNVGNCPVIDESGGVVVYGAGGPTGAGNDMRIFQNNTQAPLILQNGLHVATGTGNLIKMGPGLVSLQANDANLANTLEVYEGTFQLDSGGNFTLSTISVYGGILALAAPNTAASSSSPITVYSGGTNNIILNAQNAQVIASSNVTFNAGSCIQFVYSNNIVPSTTKAALLVTNATGLLAANSSVTVNILCGSLSVGQYPLISYSGAIGGSGGSAFVLGTIEPLVTGYISNNTANSSIDLVVTNVLQPIHWAQPGSGTWDINITSNWKDNNGNPTAYQQIGSLSDNVSFDATYSTGSPTVTLNTNPTPASVTFAGANSYTLTGSGGIGGLGSVIISGPTTTYYIQTKNSFTGGLNINGGVLNFTALTNLGGGAIIFGGGTLQYNGNTDDISTRTVTFNAGGATIDTAGQIVSYANSIGSNGVGGLTKAGSGTLTLNATNKYTGNTIVSVGTLALGSSISISNSAAIIVNSGAILNATSSGLNLGTAASQILAGLGTVNGTVTAPASTTISPATNGVIGTLTLGNLTVSGGNLYLDVASTSSLDLINVTGNLALTSGEVTINPTAGPLANGTYKLIQYSGSLTSGAGSSGNLLVNYTQTGKAITLKDSTAGEIDMVVVDNRNDGITWSGSGSSWDLVGTMDWLTNGTVTPWAFTNGDSVRFNDTGIANTTVNLQTAVLPGSVSVSNNAASPYTFADGTGIGGGKIAGPTSIVKDGPGTLIMNTANTYLGATTIKAGTLQVGSGGIGDIGGGSVTNNGALIFGQGDGQIHPVSGAISGTGSVTLQGSATVAFLTNNTYSGATTIGSGTLQVGNGGTAGSLGTGPVTNNGTIFFDIKAPVTVNNITGTGSLTFEPLTITLGSALTYLGNTYITNGLLTLAANNQIPNGATVSGSTGLFGLGGTLDLKGFNQTVNGLTDLGLSTGLITNSAASGTNVLTIGVPSVNTTNLYTGLIMDNTNGARIKLVLNGPGLVQLAAANTYSGGTIVGNGELMVGTAGTAGINGNTAAGSGGITMSNGTTLYMNGNAITFPTEPLTIAPNSTVTFNSQTLGNGYSGPISGPASSTNVIAVPLTVQVGGAGLQYMGFLGTVQIPSGGSLRIYGNTGGGALSPCGGTNTTFDIEGTGVLQTRTTETVFVGSLVGNGSITGPQSGGANIGNFVVGTKNMDSTFIGSITGNNNIIKTGAGTLTLNGSTNDMVVTIDPDSGDYTTNYIMTNGLTFTGSVTISNGVLAIVAPANLNGGNVTSFTLAASTAVLDLSSMGYSPDGTSLVTNSTLTLASPQTLTGIGTIRGSVVAGSGTTVSAGFQPNTNGSPVTGLLTITNSVELGGAVYMNVSATNTPNCTEISARTITIDSGATLTVSNLGPQNAGTFQLFNHPVSFTSVVLPALTGTNSWVNHLAVDGSITLVAPALVNTNPTNITFSVSGGGTVLNMSWPADHTGWTLEVQTNTLAVGLSNNWVRITNTASVNSTNFPIVATNGAVFYRMVYP